MKNFKTSFFIFGVSLLFCIPSNSYATSNAVHRGEVKKFEKEYVDAKAIRVTSKGIFLNKNGECKAVKGIFVDNKGKIYIKNKLKNRGYCREHGKYGIARWDGRSSCKDCREREDRETNKEENK